MEIFSLLDCHSSLLSGWACSHLSCQGVNQLFFRKCGKKYWNVGEELCFGLWVLTTYLTDWQLWGPLAKYLCKCCLGFHQHPLFWLFWILPSWSRGSHCQCHRSPTFRYRCAQARRQVGLSPTIAGVLRKAGREHQRLVCCRARWERRPPMLSLLLSASLTEASARGGRRFNTEENRHSGTDRCSRLPRQQLKAVLLLRRMREETHDQNIENLSLCALHGKSSGFLEETSLTGGGWR